ncbi:MAG: ATP-binding cassette domain-containing protein [Pseudomonadota bacterium]
MNFVRLNDVDLDLPIGRGAFSSLLRSGPRDTASDRIGKEGPGGVVHALRNVTINIESGDRVGIVGLNGAGKSTLLRVLAGIYQPTRGAYEAQGRISTLFSSTIGMNPMASGRENIFLSARTLGLSRRQVVEIEEEVIEFADLGDFLELPIRLYSDGMRARLGFAIATAIDPEILIVDEVFGVGDAAFQQRADQRIAKVMGSAGILVMASHSNNLIKRFCDKVCWVENGGIRFFGPVDEGIDVYGAGSKKSAPPKAPAPASAPQKAAAKTS